MSEPSGPRQADAQTEGEDRPARGLAVGVVGTGRVGAVLGAALARAGHRVVAASAVSVASRQRAHALLPGVALVTPPEVLARAELVLLTVPDDALPGLVEGLVDTGAVRPGQLARAHLAGTARTCSTRRPGLARCPSRCTPR